MAGIFGLSGSGVSTGVTSTATPFTSLISTGLSTDGKARSTTFAVASALTLATVASGCGSTHQQVTEDRHDQGCVQALAESEHRAHKNETIAFVAGVGATLLGVGLLVGGYKAIKLGILLARRAISAVSQFASQSYTTVSESISTWWSNRKK